MSHHRSLWFNPLKADTAFYYIDASVLLENTLLVKLRRNCIRDRSGVFFISSLVRISMTSFSAFLQCSVQVAESITLIEKNGKRGVLLNRKKSFSEEQENTNTKNESSWLKVSYRVGRRRDIQEMPQSHCSRFVLSIQFCRLFWFV